MKPYRPRVISPLNSTNINLQAWWRNVSGSIPNSEMANPFAASLTRLADTLESTLDMDLLEKIVWES